MLFYVGSSLLVLASVSEPDFDQEHIVDDTSEDTWESFRAEESGQADYSLQLDTITCLMVVIIFALGVVFLNPFLFLKRGKKYEMFKKGFCSPARPD